MKKTTIQIIMFLAFAFTWQANAQTVVIGSGTDVTGSTASDPINGFYNAMRYQVVYTAAELSTMMTPFDEITALGFDIVGDYAGGALLGYTIKIGHTAATNSAAHNTSPTVTVFGPTDYDPTVTASGVYDMITFTSNFVWNGVDNIVIDICTDGQNPYTGPYGQVATTANTTNGARSVRRDGTTACGLPTSDVINNRPNIQFNYIDGTPPTCTFAVVDSSAVVQDCAASQYSVNVEFTTVGDATGVSDGTTTYPISGTTATAGPFAIGTTQTLMVVHSDNACDFTLGNFSYDECPSIVTCGTPLNTTFCYAANDNTDFVYESSDGSNLKVIFNAGSIENCCDDLVIIDSDGVTELYRGANGGNLSGLEFTASGSSITVAVDSDGSVQSCASNQDWDWDVICLNCTPGAATTSVIEDCGTSTYTIEVVVTDAGDATNITDGVSPQAFTGTVTFGPYAFGVDTTLNIEHTDAGCDYTLGTFGLDTCPPTNDNCATAEIAPIGIGACGTTVTGNNTGATDSGVAQAGCATAVYAGGDIWYQFDMPAGETELVYTRSASAFSTTQLELFSGSCGSLVEVGCTTAATASFTGLTPSATYYVRIYDWNNDNFGDVTFCLNTPPTCPEPTGLNATNLTETTADLQWTENGTATTWDIEWGAENFTLGTGTMITGTTNNPESLIGLSASTAYDFYVRADCGAGDTSIWVGPYTFNTPGPPPANDDCSGAIAIAIGSTTSGTTFNATGASSTSCNGTIGNDVWYTVVGDGGDLTITVDSPNEDSQIGVYASPDCAGITLGTCDFSIDPFNNPAVLTFTSVAGTNYYIQVGAWINSGDPSTHDITINTTLSTQDFDMDSALTYYPNPVNNLLMLKAQKAIQQVAVYNMLGQEVLRTSPNTVASEVDMSNLQTGAYFVKVTIGKTTETIRVLKN
ncbi:T9SS type A sorting domain-containing protein [Bizionia sp.]|uniref:T9SS type A sorting domain-containing protein n=1 Tax=Bizionia sp. TaxID=1954480 RepID=UPI003A9140D1